MGGRRCNVLSALEWAELPVRLGHGASRGACTWCRSSSSSRRHRTTVTLHRIRKEKKNITITTTTYMAGYAGLGRRAWVTGLRQRGGAHDLPCPYNFPNHGPSRQRNGSGSADSFLFLFWSPEPPPYLMQYMADRQGNPGTIDRQSPNPQSPIPSPQFPLYAALAAMCPS